MNAKKRLTIKKIVRIITQIGAFLLIPGMFAASFSAVADLLNIAAGGTASAASFIEPLVILAATVPAAILFGRYFCGWFCSFGAMQDLFSFLGRKVLKKQVTFSDEAAKLLGLIKYFILLGLLALTGCGISVKAGYSPWGVFGMVAGRGGLKNLDALLSVGGILLLLIIVGSFFIHRFFCRFLCPMGAIYSLLARFHIVKNRKRCANGGDCCLCGYKCDRGSNSWLGVAVTLALLLAANLYLTQVVYKTPAAAPAVSATTEETTDNQEPVEESTATEAETIDETTQPEETNTAEPEEPTPAEPVVETFTGQGEGFRGTTTVTVTLEDGVMTDITVDSYRDDTRYFEKAASIMIPNMLEEQTAEVDTVSGATFSSRGLRDAVSDALDKAAESSDSSSELQNGVTAQVNPPSSQTETADSSQNSVSGLSTAGLDIAAGSFRNLTDGVYEGTADAFKGELALRVTVEDGQVSAIRILSYYDTEEYLFRAASLVVPDILEQQSLNVDAVSGATYSRNGIVKAVANALEIDEGDYELAEERLRAEKDKPSHHVTQKYIETDEEYEELLEKYRQVLFNSGGIRM